MEKLFSNSNGELAAWKKIGEEKELAKKFGLKLIAQNFLYDGVSEEDRKSTR